MVKKRKRISAEKKVEIIREHLDNRRTVSELAEKYGVHPNIISRWKKQLFEGALETFSMKNRKSEKPYENKIKQLEETVQKRDSAIAWLTQENIELKKNEDGLI